jgi:uncharacterized protein YdhG (YjbR/CyaY superfamily)
VARSSPEKSPAAIDAQVRAYMAKLPLDVRRRMSQCRDLILAVAPDAIPEFSYGIPGFKLDGRTFIWYAAFKHHTSLYPMTGAIRRAHADALKGYEMSTGTVRFPLANPLPLALVKRLVKARVAEVRGKAK